MANIEIKPTTGSDDETGRVVALAARLLWQGQTDPLLSSFSVEALAAAQRTVPDLPRGLLLEDWDDNWRELTERPRLRLAAYRSQSADRRASKSVERRRVAHSGVHRQPTGSRAPAARLGR